MRRRETRREFRERRRGEIGERDENGEIGESELTNYGLQDNNTFNVWSLHSTVYSLQDNNVKSLQFTVYKKTRQFMSRACNLQGNKTIIFYSLPSTVYKTKNIECLGPTFLQRTRQHTTG